MPHSLVLYEFYSLNFHIIDLGHMVYSFYLINFGPINFWLNFGPIRSYGLFSKLDQLLAKTGKFWPKILPKLIQKEAKTKAFRARASIHPWSHQEPLSYSGLNKKWAIMGQQRPFSKTNIFIA